MCYTKHKCQSKNCKNNISQEETWCQICLDSLGELLEKYPLGFVPTKFDPLN